MRGFFGIGIYHPKNKVNVGGLWRSAHIMGASFIFTIGRRYSTQCSDTTIAHRSIPLWSFDDSESFFDSMPKEAMLIGIEQGGHNLRDATHPERAMYLLGAEDHGLPEHILNLCHAIVEIPSLLNISLNVSTAGSIVMYDRLMKQ